MAKTTRLTDTTGHPVIPAKLDSIPRGSVTMINGPSGTAAQKFNSDGMWHSVDGNVYTEDELLRLRNVFLIYTV